MFFALGRRPRMGLRDKGAASRVKVGHHLDRQDVLLMNIWIYTCLSYPLVFHIVWWMAIARECVCVYNTWCTKELEGEFYQWPGSRKQYGSGQLFLNGIQISNWFTQKSGGTYFLVPMFFSFSLVGFFPWSWRFNQMNTRWGLTKYGG
jgi:hypothetical protein